MHFIDHDVPLNSKNQHTPHAGIVNCATMPTGNQGGPSAMRPAFVQMLVAVSGLILDGHFLRHGRFDQPILEHQAARQPQRSTC